MIRKYFAGSLIFTVVSLVLAGVVGYFYSDFENGKSLIVSFIITALLLGVLEVAISLDNAVVNAAVLKDMDEVWRKRFLTWGMLIAVFGMRLFFPIAIVCVAGSINPIEAIRIGLFEPKTYEDLLTSVHLQVMGFGGAFLLMVFSAHFIKSNKDNHWIPGIEPILAKIGRHGTAKFFIPILIILAFSNLITEGKDVFMQSALWGVVTFLAIDGLEELFEVEGATTTIAKNGLAGFIYLEILDASFSFDGVIAAFAITNNFLIIMLGLSVGAMFVRSLTIMLVDKGTLSEFRYLENGAFWGIGWLVTAMFLSVIHIELGELAVAGGAALAIGLSVAHSVWVNKKILKVEAEKIA